VFLEAHEHAMGVAIFVVFTLRARHGETVIRPISTRFMHKKEIEHYEKKLPALKTDKGAEEFVADADLTDYDLSSMRMVRFEFQPKSERVNMRLPRPLLDAVKKSAAKAASHISVSSAKPSKLRSSRTSSV
jgi:predicted DNA binding CopG/RHH family protein